MALNIGDVAADFTLPTDQINQEVTLSKLRGKKVVLFFYPKDETPGCTKEACDFRDSFAEFKQHGVEVFGISRDSAQSHAKFKEKYSLPFPLLVDSRGDVCEAYSVIDRKSLLSKTFLGMERATFLIDENGVIQGVWRKVKVTGHVDEVIDKIIASS